MRYTVLVNDRPCEPVEGRKRFQKALKRIFWAELKREGFQGRGATRFGVLDEVIRFVNIQGDSGGCWAYCNIDASFLFMPVTDWSVNELQKVDPATLAHGDRLRGLDGRSSWDYGMSQEEADAAAQNLLEAHRANGAAFFAPFHRYREIIPGLTAATFHQLYPAERRAFSEMVVYHFWVNRNEPEHAASFARAVYPDKPDWLEEWLNHVKERPTWGALWERYLASTSKRPRSRRKAREPGE